MIDFPSPSLIADILYDSAHRFILPRFRSLSQDQIYSKAPDDLVTIVDIETEAWLKEKLTETLVDSLFLGEESTFQDPSLMEELAEKSSQKPIWIVDPIDGTNNFVKGKSTYCSMVALVFKDEVQMAWIYEPRRDAVIYAVKGKGLFQNKRAYTGGQAAKNRGSNTSYRGNVYFKGLSSSLRAFVKNYDVAPLELMNLRCSGQDFLSIIDGKSDFSLSCNMKPWDHAQGVFMLREAKGRTETLKGAPYSPLRRTGLIFSTGAYKNDPVFATKLRALQDKIK